MHHFFPQDGVFYKANLHCHTTVSDGAMTPSEIKEAYLAQGYAAVAFTDHEVFLPHPELTDENFIALAGYETAVKERPGEHTGPFFHAYHINLLAKSEACTRQPFGNPGILTPGNCRAHFDPANCDELLTYEFSPDGVNALIEKGNAAGFLVTYNHPAWSLIPAADYYRLVGLFGMEVINGGSADGGDCSGAPLADFLRMGKAVFPIAGDDNHNKKGLRDSFSAYTMLCARGGLSYASLISALERGDGYATEGPEFFDIAYEDGVFHLHTSPVARITLLSEGRYTKTVAGEEIEEAIFTPNPASIGRFVRFELVDARGRRAISRGYFRTEWETSQ